MLRELDTIIAFECNNNVEYLFIHFSAIDIWYTILYIC